jgi:hypothetical protein
MIPETVIDSWKLKKGSYDLKDKLYNEFSATLYVEDNKGQMSLKLEPQQSFILSLEQ